VTARWRCRHHALINTVIPSQGWPPDCSGADVEPPNSFPCGDRFRTSHDSGPPWRSWPGASVPAPRVGCCRATLPGGVLRPAWLRQEPEARTLWLEQHVADLHDLELLRPQWTGCAGWLVLGESTGAAICLEASGRGRGAHPERGSAVAGSVQELPEHNITHQVRRALLLPPHARHAGLTSGRAAATVAVATGCPTQVRAGCCVYCPTRS
jgi:hypothetical protein